MKVRVASPSRLSARAQRRRSGKWAGAGTRRATPSSSCSGSGSGSRCAELVEAQAHALMHAVQKGALGAWTPAVLRPPRQQPALPLGCPPAASPIATR